MSSSKLVLTANTDEVDQINKRLSKILETRLDTDKVYYNWMIG